MGQSKDEVLIARGLDWLGRNWKWIVVLVWLTLGLWWIYSRWTDIRLFNLGDTDDNMRMMQVRGLLHGQGWFDLRQHRLIGSNIHWSRLVDLPIAGLIMLLSPFIGGAAAERWAVGIAPILPYLLLLFSVALTVRRLIDPRAYWIAFIPLFFIAYSTNGMFMPERIDHHGWQLAFLATSMAAIADPKRLRGGITLGVTTTLSLVIGLEMLIYLALAAAAMALFWVADREERDRLGGYAIALAGGTAIGFLLFVSYANRGPVCDALSPVWLSDALLGGALLFGLAWLSPGDWKVRLGLALGAGLVVAGFHALMWPHCLQRLEGVSPEVTRLWLSHVREARPVYKHGWQVATNSLALPLTGLVGWAVLIWWRRREPELLRRIIAASLPGFAATLLLFWQVRTAPAAQMLAAPGAVALIWLLVPAFWQSRFPAVRVLGVAAIAVIGLGAVVPLGMRFAPVEKRTKAGAEIDRANALCNSMWGFRSVALQPKGRVFTFVDVAPRLIAVTHHDSITGPYHRNGEQIADVMNAFRGSAEQAHRIMWKYGSDYLLTCPKSSTTTIFQSEAPGGFYDQLEKGKVPTWLRPVDLGPKSPFRMWRVVG